MAHPSQTVKDKFGEKKKLVDALKPFLGEDLWVGRENKDKGLARVSNAKLLRLFDTFTAVQSKWGTRAKLIDAILEAEGRGKDQGFRSRIAGWPVPRLYDHYKSVAHRNGTPVDAAAPKESASAKAVKTVKDVAEKAVKTATAAVEKAAHAATDKVSGKKAEPKAAEPKKTAPKK